jgi:hypothetical protein
VQHHAAESGIGQSGINGATRLMDRALACANPCFDLSHRHERSYPPLLPLMI